MTEKEDMKINPFILKSAVSEDIEKYKKLAIKTDEYRILQNLCDVNMRKDFNPYNIALLGNYGTGKSKNALNLVHEFEEKGGIGFYIVLSGNTAGQIIANIFRDIHGCLFGSRRMLYGKSKMKTFLGIQVGGAGEVELPEGFRYRVPDKHVYRFMEVMGYKREELKKREEEKIEGELVSKFIQPIHLDFEEAFTGIAEYKIYEALGSIEIVLPEEKVVGLTSPEKSAYYIGEVLKKLEKPYIGEVLKKLRKPVILVLDELEKIYKLPRSERIKFLDFLRELLDINNRNVFLFCFTRFSFNKLIKEHAALYHRIPYIVPITNFDRSQLEDFIRNRLGIIDVENLQDIYEDPFIDLLYEITGGNQRSTLFVLDRFFEYSQIEGEEPPYNKADLITFLELEGDIKNQFLDMLLYDVKERAVSDPQMSNILNILVENYNGSSIKFSELLKNERCVYDENILKQILIKMVEEDIINVSRKDDEMELIINMDISDVLGEKGWIKEKQKVFGVKSNKNPQFTAGN